MFVTHRTSKHILAFSARTVLLHSSIWRNLEDLISCQHKGELGDRALLSLTSTIPFILYTYISIPTKPICAALIVYAHPVIRDAESFGAGCTQKLKSLLLCIRIA